MATTRLRKTFKYPRESDSDEAEDLDEQEQEELITRLTERDETATELYRNLFVGTPILASTAYLFLAPADFGFTTAILCASSLLYSAYTLWTMPLSSGQHATRLESGPVAAYLPVLNGVLAAILLLGPLAKNGATVDIHLMLCALPGLACLMVLILKSELQPVDMNELTRLQYNYKGA